MASPVMAARNVVPALQVWTNRPKKASAPLGIPVSRPETAELRSDSFSGLSEERLAALEKIEHTTNYPAGAIILPKASTMTMASGADSSRARNLSSVHGVLLG
jgi:hypothetical protein